MQGILSEVVAHSKIDAASTIANHIEYEHFCHGATYVPLDSAIIIQKEACDNEVTCIVDTNNYEEISYKYTKYWSGMKDVSILRLLCLSYSSKILFFTKLSRYYLSMSNYV